MNLKRFRLLAFIALMLWALSSNAQISVASFQLLENDMTANTAGTMKEDQNGSTCALIKVVTSETGFNFDVGMLGVTATEQHTGEIWVYVPEKVRFITIAHQQLGTLRQYALPQQVASGRTYEMRLTTGKVRTIVEDAQTDQFVVFHVLPADAILEFDGEPLALDTDGSASCFKPFGKYNYRIERADYHTEVGMVSIGAEKATVDVTLKPKFGWLTVDSEVDGGDADVYVDGRNYGNLPLKALQLGSGNHTLKIIKPLYKTYQQSVKITDNDTLHVNAALKSNYRNYTISGDDDADIYVNQEYKGHGTWTGPLVSGSYRIELRRESHRTSTRSVTVKANDANMDGTITLPAPTPIYGTLKITSSPIDAVVAIDGKEVGKTPLLVKEVLIGKRSITLSKPGYRTETVSATVEERRSSDVNVTMSNIVSVRFKSNVPSATPSIDGKYTGLMPCSVDLSCTDHEVSMSADNFLTRTETVNISESASEINWELTPNRIAVTLTSNQNEAVYYVDDKKVGEGRQIPVEISYGEHVIKAVYYDKTKVETVNISEDAYYTVNFSFHNKSLYDNHVKSTAFYVGVLYQPFNLMGVGAMAGCYIKKFNFECSFIAPYHITEITNYNYTYNYDVWRVDCKIGYGIPCGRMLRVTPRIGVTTCPTPDIDFGSPLCSLTPSVQLSYVYKKLCISIAPEYYISLTSPNDIPDNLEDGTKGFNLQLGLSVIF